MRNSVLTVGHLFLISALGLSANAANTPQFNNGDMYLRADVTGGSGIIELLDSNTKKVDGICNFTGSSLEAGVNMALERIRVSYATSATVGGETNPAKLKYSTKYSGVPAELANADLVISQRGKDILTVPMVRFFNNADSQKPAGVEDSYELDSIRLLEAESQLNISIRFPKGIALPDANHFIELHLIGAQTGKRA